MRMARQHPTQQTGPLTTTFGGDAEDGIDAAGLLNTASESELATIFRDYADEPRSRRLAREIARRRASRPFETSDDLVGAIRGAFGPRSGAPEFARLFQAIRIAVNEEIGALTTALPVLRDRLAAGGRLAIIAYHSGEDRLEPGMPVPPTPGSLHLRRGCDGHRDHPPGDRRASSGSRA
jgi:16S rRNA (cytosine1402-N4)-methyltransferase